MKKHICFLAIVPVLALCGCGSNQAEQQTELTEPPTNAVVETTTAEITTEAPTEETYTIDYADAESFEAALNAGENLEGKVVKFIAGELHPDSAFGYDVYAGEHLNFVSLEHPNIKENDLVTVKATSIKSFMGSWVIDYEKVENAVETEDTTIYSFEETETSAEVIE